LLAAGSPELVYIISENGLTASLGFAPAAAHNMGNELVTEEEMGTLLQR